MANISDCGCPAAYFPDLVLFKKCTVTTALQAVQSKNKAVSSYSLSTNFMEMPCFCLTAFGSLSDAVTRLAFESPDYSGGSYN